MVAGDVLLVLGLSLAAEKLELDMNPPDKWLVLPPT